MMHTIELESSFSDGGWTAVCSCGWRGERRDTQSEASANGDEHFRGGREIVAEFLADGSVVAAATPGLLARANAFLDRETAGEDA